MLHGVGDVVVVFLFAIISSLPCFHSGWPLMVDGSGPKKTPQARSKTHFVLSHFIVASSFRSVRFVKQRMVSLRAIVGTGHPKRSQISRLVLEKEGQLIEFVWIPRDLGGRVSAEVTHAADKFGFYLGRLHSESFHL